LTRDNRPLTSTLGAATADRIWVRGFDLCRDLIGRITFGDVDAETSRPPGEAG
jgi:hypothetical protein